MRMKKKTWAEGEIAANPYVVRDAAAHKGGWRSIFQNDGPINAEIGMGKGDFIIEMAARNPGANYVGIERQLSVFASAAKKIRLTEGAENIRIIMADAGALPEIFSESEVSEIYVNFCDPWPKKRYEKRRLTHIHYLSKYEKILKAGGRLEFKTDSEELLEFTLNQLTKRGWRIEGVSRDLHEDAPGIGFDNVMTEYERRFAALGMKIYRIASVCDK